MTVYPLAQLSFYSNGWAFRVGPFVLRWANQYILDKDGKPISGYQSLSVERLISGTVDAGGLTWKEWRASQKQARSQYEEKQRLRTEKKHDE